jgi:hypothetical protein
MKQYLHGAMSALSNATGQFRIGRIFGHTRQMMPTASTPAILVQLLSRQRALVCLIAAIISMLAIVQCSIHQAGAEDRVTARVALHMGRRDASTSNMAALYAARPAVLVEYVAAMRRYQAAAARADVSSLATRLQMNTEPPINEPWIWIAASGDSVRRVKAGMFKLSTGSYLGNWFSDIECLVVEWPTFLCSDGRERRMSAPDAETVIFEGVEYKRPRAISHP